MGKNVLLLALSTLPMNKKEGEPLKLSSSTFSIAGTDEKIEDCYSQLEPVPKYLMTQGELDLVILCTKDTYSTEVNLSNEDEHGVKYIHRTGNYTALSFFVARLLQGRSEGNDFHMFGAAEMKVNLSEENPLYEYKSQDGSIVFHFIHLSEEKPEKGIKRAIDYIIQKNNEEEVSLYVDTHGGFRDISLSMSAIVSLLKVYDIRPQKIWGIRYGENKALVEQGKTYQMFEFVAGMNEFIQYGSANALKAYFDGQNDEQTQKLLDVMGQVSDGIRMCDPKEYEKGLDRLGEVIHSGTSFENEWISIFIDYIKQQYGVLLDPNQRTPLDIVRFCYRKEQYQQALTYIESRMPEYFHNKGVLYYAQDAEEIITQIKKKTPHRFKKECNFTFDNFLYKIVNSYYSDEKTKELLENKPDDVEEKDYLAVEAIKNTGSLETSFINCNSDSVVVPIEQDYVRIGEVEVFTRVPSEAIKRNNVGRLLRLHYALKNCRNLTNHATDGLHPKIYDVRKAIKIYIEWTTSVAEDIDINRVRQKTSRKTKYYFISKSEGKHNKASKTKNDKTKEKNTNDNLELEVKTVKGPKKTLRGIIWKDGKKYNLPQGIQGGVISTQNTGLKREDLERLIGRRIPVILSEKGQEWYVYKSKEPLKTYLKS